MVQELFDASDVDESGGIDREEFDITVKVSCAQIFGRMMINYATLLLVIPFVSEIDCGTVFGSRKSLFGNGLYSVVIVPMLWKIVDRGAYMEAGRQASRQCIAQNLHGDVDSPSSHHKDKDETTPKPFVSDKKTD